MKALILCLLWLIVAGVQICFGDAGVVLGMFVLVFTLCMLEREDT